MKKKIIGILMLVTLMAFCTGCGDKELKKHYEQGNEYLENGQYEEAIGEFEQAYSSGTKSSALKHNKKVYRCQGIAHYKLEEYKEAVSMFSYALDIKEPKDLDLDLLKYKILAEEALGNYEQAVLDFDLAISLDLQDFELYFGKAFAQQEAGDENYTKTLESTLTLNGKGDEHKFNLSRAYYYLEQYDVAITGFREVRDEMPEVYYYLGDCYYKKKEYDKAIENLGAALEQEGEQDKGLIYNQLGNCYLALEEYERALDYFEKGLALEDTAYQKTLWHNRVAALENLERYSEALGVCETYLKTYPEDEEMIKEKEFLKTRVK